MAEGLPNASVNATTANEILRAFMVVLSLQSAILAACGARKHESNVNKENLNARMGKRDVSQCIHHKTSLRHDLGR